MGQILADVAEQSITPALATYFENKKKDKFDNNCYLSCVYAKTTKEVALLRFKS